MTSRSPKVEHYFHRRADEFDALYEEGSRWRYYFNQWFRAGLYERVRFTLRELEGMRNLSLLDVGCGSGRNSLLFARAGARRVLGIDFSGRMIDLATQYCSSQEEGSRCEFVKADFMDYEFRERFDVAVALGVFDYIADIRPALQRMIDLTTGKIIVSFPERSPLRAPLRRIRYAMRNCPVYFYTRPQLQQTCSEIGLSHYRLVPYASSGLLLVGELQAASVCTG